MERLSPNVFADFVLDVSAFFTLTFILMRVSIVTLCQHQHHHGVTHHQYHQQLASTNSYLASCLAQPYNAKSEALLHLIGGYFIMFTFASKTIRMMITEIRVILFSEMMTIDVMLRRTRVTRLMI